MARCLAAEPRKPGELLTVETSGANTSGILKLAGSLRPHLPAAGSSPKSRELSLSAPGEEASVRQKLSWGSLNKRILQRIPSNTKQMADGFTRVSLPCDTYNFSLKHADGLLREGYSLCCTPFKVHGELWRVLHLLHPACLTAVTLNAPPSTPGRDQERFALHWRMPEQTP